MYIFPLLLGSINQYTPCPPVWHYHHAGAAYIVIILSAPWRARTRGETGISFIPSFSKHVFFLEVADDYSSLLPTPCHTYAASSHPNNISSHHELSITYKPVDVWVENPFSHKNRHKYSPKKENAGGMSGWISLCTVCCFCVHQRTSPRTTQVIADLNIPRRLNWNLTCDRRDGEPPASRPYAALWPFDSSWD